MFLRAIGLDARRAVPAPGAVARQRVGVLRRDFVGAKLHVPMHGDFHGPITVYTHVGSETRPRRG
jgi:hypothetical protein